MKRLPVEITPSVDRSIDEQVLFIAQDSVDNAFAWDARVRRYLESIGDVYGHAVDEMASDELGRTVRKTVFEGNYIIHYVIDDAAGRVRVIGLRHCARLRLPGEP